MECRQSLMDTKCITKTDGTIIQYAGYLDWFMLLYNSLQYSWNHYETADSLGLYWKEKQLTLMMILWITMSLNLSVIKISHWEILK